MENISIVIRKTFLGILLIANLSLLTAIVLLLRTVFSTLENFG